MIANLEAALVQELGFTKYNGLDEASQRVYEKIGRDPLIYLMPKGSITHNLDTLNELVIE